MIHEYAFRQSNIWFQFRDPLVHAGLKIAGIVKEGKFSEEEEKERVKNISPADGMYVGLYGWSCTSLFASRLYTLVMGWVSSLKCHLKCVYMASFTCLRFIIIRL